jgi:peptidoglycan/LPS O-acetylase OafA/YrhL
MRSSDGHHWIALDHVRAVAALMVFSWHFLHGTNGWPIPFKGAPAVVPLALLDEGHTGVALFMVLSGYLFAKLLDGKDVQYLPFFWNRFLRLFPLLVVVIVLVAVQNHFQFASFRIADYWRDVASGVVLPTLPNGGWSLTVEMHFYILLPFLMLAMRRWPLAPMMFLIIALAVRFALYLHYGEIQYLGYWTIVGRIDQFLFGIMAFQYRNLLNRQHAIAILTLIAFTVFYYWFDLAGGFYALGGKYPSTSQLWVIIPTIQGAAYGVLIAYYDMSFSPKNSGFSRLVGRAGAYSYSIYLLHPFVVFRLPQIINHRLFSLSNFYVACAAALVCFCGMIVVGWVSYHLIEKPFLRFRIPYVRKATIETETVLVTA